MLSTGMTLLLIVVAGLLGSCATAPASREDKAALMAEATSRWQQMRAEDPTLAALVQKGYGYALFPDVGKGGSSWVGPTAGEWCTSAASTSATAT